MTLSNTVPTLVSSDRPTIVVSPIDSSNFPGWGVHIG